MRESQSRRVSEALEEFHTQYGVRMKFSLVEIPDQEDWGTADSLRALRTKIKVGDGHTVATQYYPCPCN